MKSHKALFIGVLITVSILSVAWAIYWYALRSPQLILTTSPSNAVVTIDGTSVTSAKKTLSVGEHKLSVSSIGFVTYDRLFTLKRAQGLHLNILLKAIPTPVTLSTRVENSPSFVRGSEVFFLGNGGRTLYRSRADAGLTTQRVEPMTPDTLTDVQKVIWRPDGEVAFIKRSDGIYLYDFMRYDLLHQTNTLWGTSIDDIIWDPSGKRVAYTYYGADGEQSLKFADVENKAVSIVANLANNNVNHPTILWSPDGKSILLKSNSDQKKTNYLYVYDVFSKKITQVTTLGEVEGAKWSPDSLSILFTAPGQSTEGKTGLAIWVVKTDASGLKPLNVIVDGILSATWTNDSQSIVVASPQAGEGDKLLEVKIDGQIAPFIMSSPISLHPKHLITISGDERVLFFNEGQFMSLALVSGKYE